MTAYLLDVNVLVALAWPGHRFHAVAQGWFNRNAAKGWATCPLVQAGFVRIVSNPAFSPRSVSPKEAIRALATSLKHPAHHFWVDDISLASGLLNIADRIQGHQQVTDAHLLALAVKHRGILATFDKGIAALAGGNDRDGLPFELVR
jgi:toxin-antitoxin system PIN domain toxin